MRSRAPRLPVLARRIPLAPGRCTTHPDLNEHATVNRWLASCDMRRPSADCSTHAAKLSVGPLLVGEPENTSSKFHGRGPGAVGSGTRTRGSRALPTTCIGVFYGYRLPLAEHTEKRRSDAIRKHAAICIFDAACEALVSPQLDMRRLIKPMLRP